jgi:hypothetical protein
LDSASCSTSTPEGTTAFAGLSENGPAAMPASRNAVPASQETLAIASTPASLLVAVTKRLP